VRRVARIAAVATLITVAGGLAACGKSSSAPAANAPISGQTITLYNGQHEQTTSALVAAFTKQTGVKVKVRSDDEDVLAQQIEQEGSHSPADAFYTENSPPLARLAESNLLSPVDASTLAAVPAAYSAPDKTWVGVSARVSLIVYNTDKLKPSDLPTSVLDLADPKWKGKIELAPSETDFWPIVSSVSDTYGHAKALAWLKGLKANAGANIVPDNETLVADVNKGVAQLGIINHYYFARLQAETSASSLHAGLGYFAPKDAGYIKTISGAAVLKSSHFPSAAQSFVAFLTSHAGQDTIARGESFEYPLAPGVLPNSAVTPLSQLSPSGFTAAEFGTGEEAKKLLEEAQLL
jgi:iron(III) transport system substrate-binding protein